MFQSCRVAPVAQRRGVDPNIHMRALQCGPAKQSAAAHIGNQGGVSLKEYQLLLYYRYWEDMSQEDVAKLLSLSQQAVSYRERCALRQLKKIVQNRENEKV